MAQPTPPAPVETDFTGRSTASRSSLSESVVKRPSKFLQKRRSGGPMDDILWIRFTPFKIMKVNDWNMKRANAIEAVRASEWPEYEFAVMNRSELSLKHSWKKFDTVGGAAKDIMSKFNTARAATGQAGDAAESATGVDAGLGIGPTGSKNDSPLVYDDTDRRTQTLTFQFMDEGDPATDVFYVIQDFLEMTSPNGGGGSGGITDVRFEFPLIFQIDSFTNWGNNTVCKYKYACIQSVQYTFYAPYRDGYPCKGEMTLSIEDLYPTYRDSFAFGIPNNVTSSEGGPGGTTGGNTQ